MPYVMDPDIVARRGLAALGKRTIEVTDPLRRAMLMPGLVLRAAKRFATTAVMKRFLNR